MRSVSRVILRALVITAFTGLTLGASLRLSSADGGMDTGAGGMGYQQVPGNIHEDTGSGSGAGGSTDTGTGTDTGYGRGSGVDSGTGYGTGGSTETGTGGITGSGTGGSTVTNPNPSESNRNDSGSFRGGVFYPDYSNELGAGHNVGSEDNR
jgi:hypothetical protein